MSQVISLRNISKSYLGNQIFRNLNLSFDLQKMTVVFGPNGCGKSTLLNILSGVTGNDGGEIRIPDFKKFDLSYIFQNYRDSLLPWRTNFENIALPLEIQKKSKNKIKERVKELQSLFNFKFNWESYPYELSGGQQQLLSFMRAFATEPRILLIDEPFSALDYENNLKLRNHLQKYYLTYKPTILLVTHDIEEAVYLGAKIVVLSRKINKKPAIINNDLPFPRTVNTMTTEKFHRVKDKVLSAFRSSVDI